MRKNQKGFTLVELIIAVAILAIVTAAVCGFIVVGSRSYASSNTDIMLQQDAQLALNQMSDVIIDTTDSISYGLRTSGASDMQLVLKDSEFAGEATEKCLIVVNRHEDDSNNDNPSYWFYWSKEKETIYFNEVTAYSSSMSPTDIENAFKNAGDDKAILAQHVTDFSIDISQFEANRVVMISMTFENGNRTYSTSNNVTVRNRIALNEITVGPLKRAEDFEIDIVPNVTVEPGEYINLGDKVTVESSSGDKALQWECVEINGTTISKSTGQLNIGIGETRETFNVKVSRLNEEYAGQNDRVARTIKVNVKRATSVDFSGPSTAKQGEEISLTAHASDRIGLLKQACNGDNHLPDITKDKDVDKWQVMSGDAEILTSDSGSASILIHNTAAVGSKVVIRAESTLSKTPGRSYGLIGNPTEPPVWNEHVITVQQGVENSSVPMPQGFQVGTDNADGYNWLYWLDEGMRFTGTVDKYLVYARVKDINGNGPDRVILYYDNVGKNVRFYPDMFGLHWDRSYKVFLQAIIPVPISEIEKNGGNIPKDLMGKYDDDIIDKIINHPENNLDSLGKYIGSDYEAGQYFEGTLNPPAISVSINGVEYPNSDPARYEKYSFLGGGDRVMEKVQLGSNYNIKVNTIENSNMTKFTFYKEENGSWNRVAGYNPSAMSYDSGTNFTFANGLFRVSASGNLSGDPFIMKGSQNTADYPAACGNYRIVVGYEYQNEAYLSERGGQYTFIYPKNYPNTGWDYDNHYYEVPGCVIPWKVDMGLSLELIYEGKQNSEEFINFPLPTDSTFPFGGNTWNIEGKSYDVYTSTGEYVKTISNVEVKCTENNGVYTITLVQNKSTSKATGGIFYGTYKWTPGATKWVMVNRGEGSKITQSNWAPRIFINYNGEDIMVELPVPGKNGFADVTGTQTQTIWLNYWNQDDEYADWNPWWTPSVEVQVTYTKHSDGSYTADVQIYGQDKGTWTWKTGWSDWRQ